MNQFDWKVYLLNYPDICKAGINNAKAAWNHYKGFGRKEKRTDKLIGISVDKLNSKIKGKITIITPCCRPTNLNNIKINFDYVDEWIIVYDASKVKNFEKQFDNPKISEYHFTSSGISGNPQRNYGLTQVKNKETFIYFLDDDNMIHPQLYKLLDCIEPGKIYTFNQENRLLGNCIKLGYIDSAMFLIDYSLIKNLKWTIDRYDADGLFIISVYTSNPDKWVYVNDINCYYNKLN